MKPTFYLLFFAFAISICCPSAQAAVLHPTPNKEANTSLDNQRNKHEVRKANRQERRSFRKALRAQLKAARDAARDADVELVLLVILALLIPPVAMFLHDGGASGRFWISLLLLLGGIVLSAIVGILGSLAILASVVYTLLVIIGERM